MVENQLNKAIENFVAIPLIILIVIYMIASAIDPILNLNSPTFRVVFTISAGIPSLTLFIKKQLTTSQQSKK
ncbi:MAG: hypothetical protein CW716_09670 [Candidatus Bathyarchaeum sp.]|nr:MAG: hypothetical protein CW716_09670 [Candidatus Bathyarchaeum sp.]